MSRLCCEEGCENTALARGLCNAHYKAGRRDGSLGLKPTPKMSQRLMRVGWDETPGPLGSACWAWRGSKTGGYGRVSDGLKTRMAHRMSYLTWVGPIPEGLIVRHKCDNPPCINPDHLELGTHRDNMEDRVSRGRTATGESAGKSHLTWDDVDEIRSSYPAKSMSALATSFSVSRTTVSKILSEKSWNPRHHPMYA